MASSKLSLDAFLAAPDSVRYSESERRKLLSRKAKLEAEQKQLKATKSKKRPTIEDLLGDIVRVAEDKDTNPHWKFRTISRKAYIHYGHYPIEFIDREFGQFNHAKQVAGLEDKPGTKMLRANIAQASRREHAARYLERTVLPYVAGREVFNKDANKTTTVLSISDTHATYLDPFTWFVFLDTARNIKPDYIVFNGDILEGSQISRFPKIPGSVIPLQLEFDFAKEMFKQTRKASPKSVIVWNAGNHGLDRLASYLTQVAPGLASLDNLKFDELAGVKEYGVLLSQGGSFISPKGTEDDAPGILLKNFYRIYHGTKLGQNPGWSEMLAANRSGQSGHVHRGSVVFHTTESDASKTWMTTPMGCDDIAGRAYMKGLTTGWQKGFGLAFLLPGNKVHHYPIVTNDGSAVVEGFIYKKPKNLIVGHPTNLWIQKLK